MFESTDRCHFQQRQSEVWGVTRSIATVVNQVHANRRGRRALRLCVVQHMAECLITPSTVSPLPKLVRKARSKRSETSAIITSSPYKRRLVKNNANTNVKPRKSKKLSKKQTKEVWRGNGPRGYCFLCREDRQENMTRCCSCEEWLHIGCASNNTETYICDECMS